MRDTPIDHGDRRPPHGRHSLQMLHASILDAVDWWRLIGWLAAAAISVGSWWFIWVTAKWTVAAWNAGTLIQ